MAKKRKSAKQKKIEKLQKDAAQLIKDQMTPAQKIEMLNTPYPLLPEVLKPGMVKFPQMFNFIRFDKPHIGQQKETFAARLIRYRDEYNLTQERFCDVCNEFATHFDLPAMNGKRKQQTRITLTNLRQYENYNVCPKIDKMTLMARAMDIDIDYLAGYGPDNRPPKIRRTNRIA